MNLFGSQTEFNVMLHSPHFSGDTRDSKLSLNNFWGANAPTYLYDKYMTLTCLKKMFFFVALFHILGKYSRMNLFGLQKVFNIMLQSPHFSADTGE